MASSRPPYANPSSSSHLPFDGPPNYSLGPSSPGVSDHDRRPSFGTDVEYTTQYPSSQYLTPIPSHKPRASISNISLTPSDDGTEHHLNVNGTNWDPQPLVGKPVKKSFLEALFPKSLACRLYLIIVLVETFLDLVIEGTILARVNTAIDDEPPSNQHDSQVLSKNRLPVYLGIFALAHVFQFLLALDAVYHRNTLQFVFLALFNALFLLYSIIQIFEIRTLLGTSTSGFIPISVLTISIPVVVAIAEIAYVALGWKIYGEFGWSIYKQIGADRRVKGMYAQYQIFECLVRFDIFFWLGFSVQLIALVLEKGDFEFYLTIAALPLSMLLLFEGHLAARHESRWMMLTFGIGCVAALVYFTYKLFRIWKQRETDTFKDVYKSLTTFSCISILLLVVTFVSGFLVFRNFDHGLKHHMSKNKNKNEPPRQGDELEMGRSGRPYPASANPSRMSIE